MEAKKSRGNYGDTSILVEAYNDIAKLDGCKLSTPRKLYECAVSYGKTQSEYLHHARAIDTEAIDITPLDTQLGHLVAPQIEARLLGPPVEFDGLVARFDAAVKACTSSIADDRFSDVVTVEDRSTCQTGSAAVRKRLQAVREHFVERSSEQSKAAVKGKKADKMQKW